jgi:hypothetical protein
MAFQRISAGVRVNSDTFCLAQMKVFMAGFAALQKKFSLGVNKGAG